MAVSLRLVSLDVPTWGCSRRGLHLHWEGDLGAHASGLLLRARKALF